MAFSRKSRANDVAGAASGRSLPLLRLKIERQPVSARQREADVRMRDRQPPHGLGDGIRLGAIGAEEFQPGRRREEEIAHFNLRARGAACGNGLALPSAFDFDRPGVLLASMPRLDRKPRDRADRCERLTAKPKRRDCREIVAGELGGAVACDREREVVAPYPVAVVVDPDEALAAACRHNIDAARAGIERVLHQLLHDACRPLDDLAGGDPVDDMLGKSADAHRFLARLANPVTLSVKAPRKESG